MSSPFPDPMPTLFQINITANWGSHGKIAEQIGNLVLQNGWNSYIAYGRWANPSNSELVRIGSMNDERLHAVSSRIFDNHGLASVSATKALVKRIASVKPSIVHLHNIHGYYLNYPVLFRFLRSLDCPVVWTLHDCWPITGHCSHFMFSGCEKWKTGCFDCEEKREYPKSVVLDRSARNYDLKRETFTSLRNLTLVPVSRWLDGILKESFLSSVPSRCILNGIDTEAFHIVTGAKESVGLAGKKVILAVASNWTARKGIEDIKAIRTRLDDCYVIVVVGLDAAQVRALPAGIMGITRTDSIDELVRYYSAADVFINPTYEDTFPTTNIEALACGTPVITYDTGGSPESLDPRTGIVIPRGDQRALLQAIEQICNAWNRDAVRSVCRNRATDCFRSKDRFQEYFQLYQSLLNQSCL